MEIGSISFFQWFVLPIALLALSIVAIGFAAKRIRSKKIRTFVTIFLGVLIVSTPVILVRNCVKIHKYGWLYQFNSEFTDSHEEVNDIILSIENGPDLMLFVHCNKVLSKDNAKKLFEDIKEGLFPEGNGEETVIRRLGSRFSRFYIYIYGTDGTKKVKLAEMDSCDYFDYEKTMFNGFKTWHCTYDGCLK